MSLVKEFWGLMKARKKFWLAPIMIVMVILSSMMVLAATSPALSGLIYTIW